MIYEMKYFEYYMVFYKEDGFKVFFLVFCKSLILKLNCCDFKL